MTIRSDVIGKTFTVVGTRHNGDRVVVTYRSWHDDRYFGVRNEKGEGYIIRGDFLASTTSQ